MDVGTVPVLTDDDGTPLRRTPDGDLVPDVDTHDRDCWEGWLGDMDRPKPCPRCRPHHYPKDTNR